MFELISSVTGHLFCYLNFLCHLGKNGRENYISISFFGFTLNTVLMSPTEFSGTGPGGVLIRTLNTFWPLASFSAVFLAFLFI